MRLPFRLPLLAAVAFAQQLAAEPPPSVNVTIKTLAAQMKYDLETIKAQPGAKVTLTLVNDDDLPHNLVFCKPKGVENDKGMEVAMQAWNMGEAGMKADWIPQNPRVIAHTKMVNPHQKETITFTAPEETGDYPFVCTFPGHAMIMNGTFRVAITTTPIRNLHYRYYLGENLTKLQEVANLQAVEEGQLPSGKLDPKLHWKQRKNDFVYEFEGSIDCPKDGEYKFVLGSDDGSRLWIDGKDAIYNDGIHPLTLKDKKIKLTKGEHKIKVLYFQATGGGDLYLSWSGPGFVDEPLSEFEPTSDKKKIDKDKFYGIPLVVEKEPRIYRNFIQGSGPRGIAVGYPGGINLCWDADQMNLAIVWQGAFMDAKRHWTDRGVGEQPPLGYGVAKIPLQRAITELNNPASPWIEPYVSKELRNMDYTFQGYELDELRRPTFKYQYRGVTVTEKFETSGDTKTDNAVLKRVIKFHAKTAPVNLYFLALSGTFETKDKAYILDKAVTVTLQGIEPIVRTEGAKTELILPVTFKNESAEIVMNYSWNVK